MIDETASSLPDCPSLLASLLGFDTRTWTGGLNVLVELAVSMRAHGHGGSLLVVPDRAPTGSSQSPSDFVRGAAALYGARRSRQPGAERAGPERWKDAFREAVEAIAGLTAVDGATIVNDR